MNYSIFATIRQVSVQLSVRLHKFWVGSGKNVHAKGDVYGKLVHLRVRASTTKGAKIVPFKY
jgi:hypothetical protein